MKIPQLGFICLLLLFGCSAEKQSEKPAEKIISEENPRTSGYSETKNAYFGDLHIHTGWSFDAFIFNVRTGPDDAYNYGQGQPIKHAAGHTIQIKRPLDFMAVSDHAEYMGIMMEGINPKSPLSKLPFMQSLISDDPAEFRKAFLKIGTGIATNKPEPNLVKPEIVKNTWEKAVAIADKHYKPGEFTTFPAYEWTSSIGIIDHQPNYAQNLHRNVIFKNSQVPEVPFSSFDSQNPEKLWEWMEMQRETGIEVLAIPHNSNISDGRMYEHTKFDGSPIDLDYAKIRSRNEPVSEVVQVKGNSMTHPALSPNDEFADFEIYTHMLGRGQPRAQSKAQGGYIRSALKGGLEIDKKLGVNPFVFGFIGSSDTHNSASNVEEDNYIGKSGIKDPTPQVRMEDSYNGSVSRDNLVAGLAGVWAKENTREAIFDAISNKETFATSGPRMKVRFFASTDFDDVDIEGDWLSQAYSNGTAMGGKLPTSKEAPRFLIEAMKDPEGANLDRVQVIKGWIDAEGKTHEKVFEVAWAGNRRLDENGKLAAIGNTVDLNTATYENSIGAVRLAKAWTDPEFDPSESAFYYVRVLEIPTPRWSTYDAVRIGVPLPKDAPAVIQERAWSSPIWN